MTEETTTVAPQLSLNDIVSAIRIIDICAERGAFKGAELEGVGAVRGRFALFAQANMPEPEVEPEVESEEEKEGE